MVGRFQRGGREPMPRQAEQAGAGAGHQQRRMRGHDHLAVARSSSIRRSSFRNSIWRDGGSADSGSSKMKMPSRWQRSSKKRRKPSPCECERKSGGAAFAFQGRFVEIARDGEEIFRAEEPAVRNLG